MLKKIVICIFGITLLALVAYKLYYFFPTNIINPTIQQLDGMKCGFKYKAAAIDYRYVYIQANATNCYDTDMYLLFERGPNKVCNLNPAWQNKPTCETAAQEEVFKQVFSHTSEPNFGFDSSHTVKYYDVK